MSDRPKFLADAMLGNIARKLRLFGFDCKYFATIEDDQLLSIAKSDDRTIITKDHEIVSVCKKQNIPVIELFNQDEIEQIVEICKKIGLTKCKIDMTDIRCTICNGAVQPVDKEKIIDRIPVKVEESIQQFWLCDSCNHVYWKGTHIRNLQKFIILINTHLNPHRF